MRLLVLKSYSNKKQPKSNPESHRTFGDWSTTKKWLRLVYIGRLQGWRFWHSLGEELYFGQIHVEVGSFSHYWPGSIMLHLNHPRCCRICYPDLRLLREKKNRVEAINQVMCQHSFGHYVSLSTESFRKTSPTSSHSRVAKPLLFVFFLWEVSRVVRGRRAVCVPSPVSGLKWQSLSAAKNAPPRRCATNRRMRGGFVPFVLSCSGWKVWFQMKGLVK